MTDRELRITVDSNTCAGTTNCERIAPNTFRVVKGQSEVIDPAGDPEEDVIDAAMSCPLEAIAVSDTAGTVLFPAD